MNSRESEIEGSVKMLELGAAPSLIKKEYVIGTDKFWLHDTCYEYAVLDTSKIPKDEIKLPEVFVLRTESYLAVSDTYPEAYRRLGIVHEVKEYFQKEPNKNSCVEAVGYELDQATFFEIRAKEMPEYLKFRLDFFDKLIKFYEAEKNPDYEEILTRLRHSRSYLEECVKANPASADSRPTGQHLS